MYNIILLYQRVETDDILAMTHIVISCMFTPLHFIYHYQNLLSHYYRYQCLGLHTFKEKQKITNILNFYY